MHRLMDFAEHFLGLLQNSGSTGSSGSRACNGLAQNTFVGTTEPLPREPVKAEWFSGQRVSGSNEIEQNQLLTEARTTGTTRTTTFEQGRARELWHGCPQEWHAVFAELNGRSCPDWLSPDRWSGLLSDAEAFLSQWGKAAHQFGWSELDLFGVHPAAPTARFDVMGLVPVINGGKVASITERSAAIQTPGGSRLMFMRRPSSGAICLRELVRE